jgi:hypothetical protein
MMEFFAATWWCWLVLALISFASVGINWVLVTYGTAIDVGSLAYKASKLTKEDLPNNKEEFKDAAIGVAKDQAISYAKAKAFSKARKIFFGVVMLGFGAFSAGMFLATLLVKTVLWITSGL